MASPLILLVTFFIVAAAQLADANKCEGTYTFNKEAILEGIYSDIECKGFIKKTQKGEYEAVEKDFQTSFANYMRCVGAVNRPCIFHNLWRSVETRIFNILNKEKLNL